MKTNVTLSKQKNFCLTSQNMCTTAACKKPKESSWNFLSHCFPFTFKHTLALYGKEANWKRRDSINVSHKNIDYFQIRKHLLWWLNDQIYIICTKTTRLWRFLFKFVVYKVDNFYIVFFRYLSIYDSNFSFFVVMVAVATNRKNFSKIYFISTYVYI